MSNRSGSHPAGGILAAMALLCALGGDPAAGSPAAEPAGDAAAQLAFESHPDGKCHILSEGGKLRLMRNVHPERAVHYRLIRYFAGRPQPGRVTGTIAPDDTPVRLGCTRVDGREQHWEIESATFQ